jgi:hypothetical protein
MRMSTLSRLASSRVKLEFQRLLVAVSVRLRFPKVSIEPFGRSLSGKICECNRQFCF